MKTKLYRIEAVGAPDVYVVAKTEPKAVEIYVTYEINMGIRRDQFTTERVDQKLPLHMWLGLDQMLARTVQGIAVFEAESGWFLDPYGHFGQQLWRFYTPKNEQAFVVAPDSQTATAIYMASYPLDEGEHRLFRFEECGASMPKDHSKNLAAVLEFGPVGIASWSVQDGWTVEPF